MKTLIKIIFVFLLIGCTKPNNCYICNTSFNTLTYKLNFERGFKISQSTEEIKEELCNVLNPESIVNNQLMITEGAPIIYNKCTDSLTIITHNWSTKCIN